ncbi:Hypothetical predicted protein [Lecanosticta acicola]|uniref:Uncharacterized protein n=1 Tax=Lecanosticta acicola TaxID=111012 RepID=A0AAI8YVC4_9PEZI|nr:Hypothetical predicted protein [Lecanosticta acicola]
MPRFSPSRSQGREAGHGHGSRAIFSPKSRKERSRGSLGTPEPKVVIADTAATSGYQQFGSYSQGPESGSLEGWTTNVAHRVEDSSSALGRIGVVSKAKPIELKIDRSTPIIPLEVVADHELDGVASLSFEEPLALSGRRRTGSDAVADIAWEQIRREYHDRVDYRNRIQTGHVDREAVVRHVSIRSQIASIEEASEDESGPIADPSAEAPGAAPLSPLTESWLLEYWTSAPPSPTSLATTYHTTTSSSTAASEYDELEMPGASYTD